MTAYYVNVAEWSPEQVVDWMRGLDDTLLPYMQPMLEQEINGHRLLSTTVEDLPVFHIDKLGHQEIFMGAVDLLRDFHYNLDRENLQFLAMQLNCKARSLYNELLRTSHSYNNGKAEQVTTATLAAVADIIDRVKDLLSWLDRAPFDGHEPYLEVKSKLLEICLELATNAQRDLFAEHPVQVIRKGCIYLITITDRIVCEFLDPLVLQPASLDVATVKKKPEEDVVLISSHSISSSYDGTDLRLQGMLIQTSYKGVHVIGGVTFQSPAHQCGKIEEGDEIVQVNYQTVVGWQQKKLKAAMLENPTKVILTLKKRPRHSNNFGQIYVKPYRLPSKKRESYHFRWHLGGESQTKPELTSSSKAIDSVTMSTVPVVHIAPPVMAEVMAAELPSEVESDDTDDDSFLPDNHDPIAAAAAAAAVAAATGSDMAGCAAASPASVRLILPKNRLSIQRRATVTGASPTSSRPTHNIEQFWKQLKGQQSKTPELFDFLHQQQQQPEQRPHSSVGHYDGQPRIPHKKDPSVNQSDTSAPDKAGLLLLREKEKVHAVPSALMAGKISEEPSDLCTEFDQLPKDNKQIDGSDVEIRSPSRKVSQDRPRLDKSQSTPTYESLSGDMSSIEEKLRDIRLRKQSRVEEEAPNPVKEDSNHSPCPISVSNSPPLSPKPALPPRNKVRPPPEEDTVADPALVNAPTESTSHNSLIIPSYGPDDRSGQEASAGVSSVLSNSASRELSHLGLRPHEIRDLIRRGLWPRHPTDEDRALPALTRVTRLDSNFDPVPGSTVPRIAPSLLVTYARHDEEVHVALPPVKTSSHGSSHYGAISSASRTQYQHLSQRPANYQQQQQQQCDNERSTSDGLRHRRVPCRELGEGDCQGWLFRRRQTRGFFAGPRWTRRFFVLKRHTLYGYRDPEDQKAESLICLPGFSSSVATEVKSKKFAFRVFNPGTMFYFACETKEELNKWLNTVKQSATAPYGNTGEGSNIHKDSSFITKGAYYSETEDESLDEAENHKSGLSATLRRRKGKVPPALPPSNSHKTTPFEGAATLGRIKKSPENPYSTEEKSSPSASKANSRSPMAASLDRKYLRFLRVAPEKQPVPTPQFRSYRKPSPSPSPTATAPPTALPPSPCWMDGSKPPPRPPNDSKPASPFKPLPSPHVMKDPVELNESSFDFSSPVQPKHPHVSRHSAERAAPRSNPSDAINAFRKSISTSKLPSTPTLQLTNQSVISEASPMESQELKERPSSITSFARRSSRPHSIEIIDSKSPKSPVKPQLAPKPNSARTTVRHGSEPPTDAPAIDGAQRRANSGSWNRSNCGDIDIYGSLESGYAKIKPRNASSASDYFRSGNRAGSTSSSPKKAESVGRRSSVSSSRRSSTDCGSTVKCSGVSSSLSKLPSPSASLSPASPSRGMFDFNNVDPSGKSYRQGPPDQLWINSLRSGMASSPGKHGCSPDRPKNSSSRLKSAACYQPMNFPLSPKDDAKMRTAFEMSLDITSPPTPDPEIPKMTGAAADAKQFFKMLVSPKFGRKTTPSPSIPAKSKMLEASSFATTPSPRSQKTLLGSPRLHRAIFGNSREKRKKLLETGESHLHPFVPEESVLTLDDRPETDETQSSFNSSLSSEFSPRFSPAPVNHHRSHQRPPPLINPVQSPSVSSSCGIAVVSPYEDGNGSCPGTPKTPSLKPAMGVSMIGKQRRTPVGPDSPFGLPPSPGPLTGGSLRHSSSTTRFPYSLTPKEASPAPAPPLIQSTGELEYPPVFEPGTYSLSEKNVEMHVSSTRSSLASSTMPPVPAPRTKFLSSTTSRLSHSPSMDSNSSATNSNVGQPHRIRLESRRSIDESSNA
ncbi:uncharacterized protein LOC130688934 isoform X4 [Daphnia carinata]|uniref:uncharacterized protein LOC130688934 isoform X4 n=1 Tax=Daphnia carinata TaxID=120202 RepID=UPI0028689C10|nr:uncharacterized protein LOC130688934 isoform X4 [Daphnia carinata]